MVCVAQVPMSLAYCWAFFDTCMAVFVKGEGADSYYRNGYQLWQFDMPEETTMHPAVKQQFVKKHRRNSSLPDAFYNGFIG